MGTEITANSIVAEEWSGAMGEKWLANLDRFEGMIAPVGAAFLDHAGFRPGERVVDSGCGGGGTTIAIAEAVGPSGEVLGIDISPALVAAARKRAAGLAHVRFRQADAATVTLEEPPFDRLFSRFGSMFFPDPAGAFANLRRLIRDGGRADFAVWAPARENGCIAGMMEVLARHIELPAPVPHAPGPFSLDDPDYVRPLLLGAGFTRVDFTRWNGEQLIGGAGATAGEAADFALSALSFADALADTPDVAATVRNELQALFAAHQRPAGIAMGGAAWFVTATT
ncbi:MAG TPA: class I SAM-dependent methyltransferase [Sphingomonadaceae bacterium]|nr:class I SAM-dependent methyltransferase [Sphingomonadaceae bacterium]